MDSELTPETIDRLADRHGLSLDEAARDRFLEAAQGLVTQVQGFEPETPTSDGPEETRPGSDPHGAFRTRFDLPGDDGPLSDLEVAVKENTVVAGVETTCGSPAFSYTPPYSATVVGRLREAGATVTGTTNMDEFAFFTTGETCAHGPIENPVVEGCVPGGSSSGSGAAVAAGLVDAALGTDTGGSIRIPASFCGVVGVKPTHRLVPRFGVVDLSLSLDHVGPLASDVETAAAVTEAIAGSDPFDPSTHNTPADPCAGLTDDLEAGVDGLTLGVVEEAMAAAEDGVRETVEDACERLEAAGATVERCSLEGYDLAGPAVGVIAGAEFARFVAADGVVYGPGTGTTDALRSALASANESGAFGENVRTQLVTNGAVLEATGGRHYLAACDFARRFTAAVRDRLSSVDALVTPTTPIPAPEFGEIQGMEGLLRTITNTAPFNLTGTPAASVACGETDGKPVGLQVVTDRYEEATALRVARAVETTT